MIHHIVTLQPGAWDPHIAEYEPEHHPHMSCYILTTATTDPKNHQLEAPKNKC